MTGPTHEARCMECGGEGWVVRSSWPYETANMEQESCDACDGSGRIPAPDDTAAERDLGFTLLQRAGFKAIRSKHAKRAHE